MQEMMRAEKKIVLEGVEQIFIKYETNGKEISP